MWFSAKQSRVALGLAKPHFPYGDYSVEELDKLYPQYVNEDVETTQAPEETHAKFIAALKVGDLNEAVECCFRQGDWDGMKEALNDIKSRELLGQMVEDLDAEIKIDFSGDSKASYEYIIRKNNQKFSSTINFVKNNRGVWLIESL